MNSLAFHLRVGPREMRWLVVASLVGLMAPAHAATTGGSVAVDCAAGGAPEAVSHCKTDQASALAQVRKPRVQDMLVSRIRTRDVGDDAVLGDYSSKASFADSMTVVPARPEWTGGASITFGLGVSARLQRSVLNIDVDLSSPLQLGGPGSYSWTSGPLPAGVILSKTSTGFQLDARSVNSVTTIYGGFRAYLTMPFNGEFSLDYSLATTVLSNGFVDSRSWLNFVDLNTVEPEYGRLVAESGYRYPVTSVPEVGSWITLALGLGMLTTIHPRLLKGYRPMPDHTLAKA